MNSARQANQKAPSASAGEQDAVRRPATADNEHRCDRRALVPLDPRRVPEGERREIDQAVAGRHEGRHVVEAVGVDLQRRAEDVLHQRREGHHHQRLGPHHPADPGQGDEQQHPGDHPEAALLPQTAATAGPVEPEHHGEPAHHQEAGPARQLASHQVHGRRPLGTAQ
jgi:hypothetical protein